ncbi:hypothetical protein NKR23_g4475 [Pleurostoma richardsiae]|uniref:Uncharacterized protein n=1 Tax=Pleurostoma richardsiae TaxID=41990 RepID=A0AA38RJ45_9PEZI|nr:hypothetical protein NKR23_g4475 [Pleurostoma richardsiae]
MSSAGAGASTKAQPDKIQSIIETRPVKFHIQTGGAKYACEIHPNRPTYERVKASSTSITSASSTSSASTTSSK